MKRCRIVHGGNGLGGTVSRIETATGALPTISAVSTFNMLSSDGTQPSDGVVEANDVLYGTASSGDANWYGTICRIDLATSTEITLHSFQGTIDGTQSTGELPLNHGLLYGISVRPTMQVARW